MRTTWQRAEALDVGECMQLLSTVRLGRCAWAGEEGPQVLPVNHAVVDGQVYFRTDLYGVLAEATRSTAVAYEADELDDRMQSGWSVLVVGTADQVDDPDEVATLFRRLDEPWAPGSRPVVVRITPSRVTGRRFSKG
jgi:nitroimidazol reductase NimA-like FMN-containing flavoprotein (pyridoxamine 5'-phosphate oxidase superfamily)